MNSGSTEKLYDTTGEAAALAGLIHSAGQLLLETCTKEAPTKAECRYVIVESVKLLRDRVRGARRACERLTELRGQWQMSRSLRVALLDVGDYVERLAAFDAEEADHTDDAAYAASAIEIAVCMRTRDHAYRVACASQPGVDAPTGQTKPSYADENDSAVVSGVEPTAKIIPFPRRKAPQRPQEPTPDGGSAA